MKCVSAIRIGRNLLAFAATLVMSLAGCGHSDAPSTSATAASSPAATTPSDSATVDNSVGSAPTSASGTSSAAPAANPQQTFIVRDRQLYDQAVKQQNDEKFDEAGKVFQQIVELNAQFCGNDHYRTRFARNRLRENGWMASLSTDDRKKLRESRTLGETSMEDRAKGRPAAAVDHTRRSADILAAMGGKETIAYGKLCELNGVSSADLGDLADADRSLRAAIETYGKTVGHPSLEEASALAAMSEMYAMHGDISPSLQCIMQAVNAEAACRVAGSPDAMAPYLLCKLGRRYRDLAQYALAEQVFLQATNIARLSSGIRSNEYIGCTQDLAATYLYAGKLQQTESLELEVLELISQGTPGSGNTMEILARGLLGCAYAQMGKFDMASPVLLRTLDLARNTLDEKSPYVGLLEGGVAELYIAKKQYAQAEPLLKQALAQSEPKNNAYKPWFMRVLHDQITMLHATGRDAEADQLQSRWQTLDANRLALCAKLRDAKLLPKESDSSAAEIASRPTTAR